MHALGRTLSSVQLTGSLFDRLQALSKIQEAAKSTLCAEIKQLGVGSKRAPAGAEGIAPGDACVELVQ